MELPGKSPNQRWGVRKLVGRADCGCFHEAEAKWTASATTEGAGIALAGKPAKDCKRCAIVEARRRMV